MKSYVFIIFIIIVILARIGVSSYFFKSEDKWSCEDGRCEISINVDFKSKQKCIKKCREVIKGNNDYLNNDLNNKLNETRVKFAEKKTEIDINGNKSFSKT